MQCTLAFVTPSFVERHMGPPYNNVPPSFGECHMKPPYNNVPPSFVERHMGLYNNVPPSSVERHMGPPYNNVPRNFRAFRIHMIVHGTMLDPVVPSDNMCLFISKVWQFINSNNIRSVQYWSDITLFNSCRAHMSHLYKYSNNMIF